MNDADRLNQFGHDLKAVIVRDRVEQAQEHVRRHAEIERYKALPLTTRISQHVAFRYHNFFVKRDNKLRITEFEATLGIIAMTPVVIVIAAFDKARSLFKPRTSR